MKKILIVFILVGLFATWANATVTVVNTKQYNDTRQWIYVTLTVDGDTIRWDTDSPLLSGSVLTDWVDAREDKWKLRLLKEMYSGARYQSSIGGSGLEKFKQWITDGHTNTAYCQGKNESTQQTCQDEGGTWIPGQAIAKVLFQDSWQPVKVNAEKNMATSVLYNKTDAQIDAYIDNNITDMASSKAFLKKLTKQVRNVVRRQGWSDN